MFSEVLKLGEIDVVVLLLITQIHVMQVKLTFHVTDKVANEGLFVFNILVQTLHNFQHLKTT
jgi:hypothetical protein